MIKKWKQLSFDLKAFYLFLFFSIFILARIVLETGVLSKKSFLSYYVVFHHFFWFSCVLFWFIACFRYILRLDIEKAVYLMFAAPIVHIPLVYAIITGHKMRLVYVKGGSIAEVLHDIAVLMYGHPKNHPQFYELALLLALFIIGSYFFSRSLWRTVLNVLVGFYGSFLCLGVFWFGVAPKTKAYIKVSTSLKNHQMLALVFFSFSVILFGITFWKEVREFWKKTDFLSFSKNIFISVFAYYIILFFISFLFFKKSLTIIDYIILFAPFFSVFTFFNIAKKNAVPLGFKCFSGCYAAAGLMLGVPIIIQSLFR